MAKKIFRSTLTGLILFSCSLACERAQAQFSFPYDPDFSSSSPSRREEAPPPPQEIKAAPAKPEPSTPEEVPGWMRDAGPFLLFDRPNPDHFFEAPVDTAAPKELSEFLRGFSRFTLDQRRWNRMRQDYERGTMPHEEIEAPPISTESQPLIAFSTAAPKPAPPEVELPTYGTSLSITGRKVIGVSFSEKRFLHDQVTTGRPKSTNLIDITQQLQLRMQGKVGPKITVNVDYDDTKTNKQDISVVYQGDPNEVVQNASFGDIDLSLPATEFVSYNKQLFGIRVTLKYKGFNFIFIGSRTKGTTKAKRFTGNTQFASTDILDTAYIRHRYYDLTFGNGARLPLRPGSERVFVSKPISAAPNVNDVTLTVDDLSAPSSTFTGTFDQLASGVDYTVDYVRGILTLRNSIDPSLTLAVNFVDATAVPIALQSSTATGTANGTGLNKIIKTFGDQPIVSSTTESGFNRELLTFYSIGQTQVIRDNGQGNFILKVLDQSRNFVGPSLTPPQVYPNSINVDFENGIFQLLQPFGVSASSPTPDPTIYSPTPLTKRLIHLEYNFRLKTFFLEPNLVLQSEIVLLDNVKLQRNVDYFIDYDSGFITFFNPQRIQTSSVIDISYEVAPFAGVATESLLGTRASYDFNKHFAVGSTLLYDTGNKPNTVPSITDLSKSMLVYEGDSQLKDIQLTRWLKASLQGEIAQSVTDPNLYGRALVDNMEGIRQDDAAVMQAPSWFIASNPTSIPADPLSVTWNTEDVKTLQINPNAQANQSDITKVLDLNYDFSDYASTEASLVYVFSPTGRDFTQKSVLEVTMFQSTASLNQIDFHLGGINEDADGAGGITLHCADGSIRVGVPKTEDTNCDGILQPSEDTGWVYSPATSSNTARFGAGNGRIDSEDLDQNGRLDPQDFSGDDYGYVGANPGLFDATANSTITTLNFTGWHTFEIPLNISSATIANWTAIKEVRISVRKAPGGQGIGTVKFAKVSVVGNTWQRGQAGDPSTGAGQLANESLQVSAVNNIANPNYRPIFSAGGDAQQVFNDLYGSTSQLERQNNTANVSEQALQLRFAGLTAGTTVYTKRIFPRSVDISQHSHFSFLVYGNADPTNAANGDKVIFVRVGSDQSFFEMDIPVNFTGWKKFTANQVGIGGSQTPSVWQLGQGTPGTVVFSSGTPSLQNVGEIVVGVYSNGNLTTAGTEWIDEMYLDGVLRRTGLAEKLQIDLTAPGWGAMGFKHRSIDRNYQTPTTVVTNQDNRVDTAYLNFDRFKFMPLRFNLSRTIVETPNTSVTSGNSNLINLLQQGKVTTWVGNANANIVYGSYPRLTLGYDRNRIEYDLLTRLDDKKTYNGSMSYGVPLNRRYLPKTIDLNATYLDNSVSYGSFAARTAPGDFNTQELTRTYGGRMSFIPWNGSTFNPTYSVSTVHETRRDLTQGPAEIVSSYPKALTQSVGFASNFRLSRWLNPSLSYNISTIENNNLVAISTLAVDGSSQTVFNVGDIKTVNRSANGNLSLNLSMAEIMPKTKLFRSLNFTNGYQIQDGDVTQNVGKDYDTRFALWVRTPLHPTNANPAIQPPQLMNQTLRDTYNSTQRWSPLEAYALTGRKAAFKTLSITNNFVQSIQRTNTTGTPSKTISTTLPDLIMSMSQLEQILYLTRLAKNMQMNLRYQAHRISNVGTELDTDSTFGADLRAIIKNKFDTSVSFNLRGSNKHNLLVDANTQKTDHKDATVQTTFDIRKFRFTPKVDYASDVTTLGTGVQTANTTIITPSLLIRSDTALPRGLYIPFTKRTLAITNRVIWTTTMSLAFKTSPVTIADNSKLATLNTSADYEVAKNLRMTLNGQVQRLWHNFLKEEEFMSFQFGTTMTFQF